MSQAPRVVGRYMVWEPIASGGMASVHFARLFGPEGFSRTVAIKQLHPLLSQDSEFVAMFLNEARLASRIRHPNVVSPLDIVKVDEELFIVMEYVHGESLGRLLRANGTAPIPERISSSIMMQVLLGLHAAHEATSEQGGSLAIVHRDVSPPNILVGQDGVARVVDFGIAKAASNAQITADGNVKGKFGYMSPEQVRGEPLDRRTDVFAAGVVLWEMLTGVRLFPGDTPAAVVEKILHAPIHSPAEIADQLDRKLSDVVVRALARNRDERYADARQMAIALSEAVPAASALEVTEWVSALSGIALAIRAERVLEIEAISPHELTLPRVPAGVANQGETSLGAAASGADAVQRSDVHTETSLTRASEARLVPARRASFKRRIAVFALVAAVASLALAATMFLPFGIRHSDAGGAAAAIRSSHSERPVSATASTSAQNGEQSAAPPVPAGHSAQSPNAVAAPVPAASEKLPKSESAQPLEKANKKARLVVKPVGGKNAKGSRPDCEVLYTVDKEGVKRFKPECF